MSFNIYDNKNGGDDDTCSQFSRENPDFQNQENKLDNSFEIYYNNAKATGNYQHPCQDYDQDMDIEYQGQQVDDPNDNLFTLQDCQDTKIPLERSYQREASSISQNIQEQQNQNQQQYDDYDDDKQRTNDDEITQKDSAHLLTNDDLNNTQDYEYQQQSSYNGENSYSDPLIFENSPKPSSSQSDFHPFTSDNDKYHIDSCLARNNNCQNQIEEENENNFDNMKVEKDSSKTDQQPIQYKQQPTPIQRDIQCFLYELYQALQQEKPSFIKQKMIDIIKDKYKTELNEYTVKEWVNGLRNQGSSFNLKLQYQQKVNEVSSKLQILIEEENIPGNKFKDCSALLKKVYELYPSLQFENKKGIQKTYKTKKAYLRKLKSDLDNFYFKKQQ